MSSKIDTNDHIISFEDVHKWFGNFHVLKGINIKIDKGEVVVVFGPSGSGKSTFIRTINRLEEHQNGKITIDGITKYYLLDTGASDLIINREIERDLLINGSIRQEDYLGKQSYILADNKEVNAQLVRLKNVKIGDYILNNVIAAIIDEGSLLCGTGLLNKFRKYEIINDEGILILYK